MSPELFQWHEQLKALVVVDHAKKQAVFYPTKFLRAIRLRGEDQAYRVSLPRFDSPQLLAGDDKDVMRAAMLDSQAQAVQRRIRG